MSSNLQEPLLKDTQKPEGDPRVTFIIKLGRALHKYGTPTHRLEGAMNLVLQRLGLDGNFFSMPTGILVSFGLPEERRTSLIRIEPGETDLEKLTLLDELTGQVIGGDVSVAEGAAKVDEIVAAPSRYSSLLTIICYGLASCTYAIFFGGGWREVIASSVIGLALGGLAEIVKRSEDTVRVFEPVAAVISSALAMLATQILSPVSTYITTLAGLIVLVPGLTLTVAMRELATRNLMSGTARLMGAILIFLEIGFGVALGRQLGRVFQPSALNLDPVPLAPWTIWVALIVAPLAFSVLLRAMPRDVGWIMIASGLSFGGARAGALLLGPDLGACLGAILVGAGGNLYARLLDRPATIPVVPSILLLVPGSIGYGSFAKFLEKDVISGIETAFNAILIAVALVTGLLIANLIVRPRKAL